MHKIISLQRCSPIEKWLKEINDDSSSNLHEPITTKIMKPRTKGLSGLFWVLTIRLGLFEKCALAFEAEF